jgi:hypothetical protein
MAGWCREKGQSAHALLLYTKYDAHKFQSRERVIGGFPLGFYTTLRIAITFRGFTCPLVRTKLFTMDAHLEREDTGHSLPSVEEVKVGSSPTAGSSSISRFLGGGSKQRKFILIGGLVVLLVVVIGVAVGVSNNNKSSSSNLSASGDREQAAFGFLSLVSSRDDIANEDSPQNLAAHWIATEDELQVPVPSSLRDANAYKFVQRYALAVLYYALSGDDWEFDHHFVTDVDECGWSDGFKAGTTEFHLGVGCNDKGQVYTLYMRKFFEVLGGNA